MMRLISNGSYKLLNSDGTHKPAVLSIKERAAAKKIFGSDSLNVVPKSIYMPDYLLSIFLALNKNDSSLFSSMV
jgi:hypothetical protein